MSSPAFNSMYNNKYLSTDELKTIGGASAEDYVRLEITTRAGKGAYMKRSPGVVLYKPMIFSLPIQFYRPRYSIKSTTNTLPDLRSTIHWEPRHWEPSVVTYQDGKAIISFYTADKPSNYTVIIEGSDLLGTMGNTLKKGFIKIK